MKQKTVNFQICILIAQKTNNCFNFQQQVKQTLNVVH